MSKFDSAKRLSLVMFTLLIISACGGKKSGGNSAVMNNFELQDDVDGVYQANLSALNETVAGKTTGTMTIRMYGDELVAEGAIAGAPEGIKHYQFITAGPECPTLAHDVNGDQLIDAEEALNAAGKVLIPLDSNLKTQIDGMDFGPIANPAGAIVYRRSTSVTTMLDDLMSEDPDPTDHLLKVSPFESFVLTGKKVLIMGVSAALPDSAKGLGTMSAAESLPIACGELNRISSESEPLNLDL